MRWFKRAWNDLSPELIHNCRKHTGLLFGPLNANAEENELAMAAELEHQVSGLVAPAQRMSIAELLNPQGENDCLQAMTDEEMVSYILSGIVTDEESPENSDEETNGGALPGAKEQLQALALTKRIADCAGADSALFSSVRKLQTFVRLESSRSAKQTTMHMFFQ